MLRVLAAVLALLALGALIARHLLARFFYPVAGDMPPVVSRPIDEIIGELEALLREKAPPTIDSFNPGLTDERIGELETAGRFRLPDDLKAIYRWHNGCSDYEYPEQPGPMCTSRGPMPGHRFFPLDEAIALRDSLWTDRATLLQRLVFWLVAGHTTRWLTIFGDGSGDGYFFDPSRNASNGNVFYSFLEDRNLAFFPSVSNLLAWMVRCYEQDVFRWSTQMGIGDLNEDFELAWKIREEFASVPY